MRCPNVLAGLRFRNSFPMSDKCISADSLLSVFLNPYLK
jgi:hypothetical protein